jgi:Kef-type K+ transport system membrane component KefB
VNVNQIQSYPFLLCVIAISVLSKILSGWVGGKMVKMSDREALGLGVILNGRGVMGLVVASIGLQNGFIGEGLFSVLVIMGLFTTLITPMIFKRLYALPGNAKA